MPLPLPDAPDAIVIHEALLTAVHEQVEADAVTVIVPVPPLASKAADVGEIVTVHGGGAAAACVTVKVCPAIEAVPVRAAPVLAAVVTTTLPLPVPLARSSVIHAAPGDAAHAQVEADAVTVTVVDAPVSGAL